MAVTAAALVISAAVGIALVLAGTDITGAIVYAAAVLGVILTFATGAVLAAQIMPTRSSAVGVTVALLGVALLVRMLADGCAAVCLVSLDDPVRPDRPGRPLRSQPGRPVTGSRSLSDNARAGRAHSSAIPRRRQRRGEHVDASRAANQALEVDRRVCGSPLDRAHARLGDRHRRLLLHPRDADRIHPRVLQHQSPIRRAGRRRRIRRSGLGERLRRRLFGLLAIPTGLYAATRLARLVADERARRWTAVFATDVSRIRLVGTEIAVTTAGLALLHVIAGLAIWAGAAITAAPLALDAALAGALNSAPIAWLAVGAASLAVGWLPSGVGAAGAMPVAGGFLLNVVTKGTSAPSWIVGLSPFAHLAAVPDAPPDWTATAVFLLIGTGMLAAGIAGYARRDLTT